MSETCCLCGRSCARGSGRFINRYPVLGNEQARRAIYAFPRGKWVCGYCKEQLEAEEIADMDDDELRERARLLGDVE
jgi:hypothetical protein